MYLRSYLVEDNPTIRINLIAMLKELAEVETVGFADAEQDAVEWLAEHPQDWDIVIIDLFLRQGSGMGVLQACTRLADKHHQLIVLSNYATQDIQCRCKELGAHAVFDKSNDIESLIAYCTDLAGAKHLS